MQQFRAEYYSGLDICRLLAAFGIVGCHLALDSMTPSAVWVKRFTDLNVGVFAMLSGFFMAKTLVGNPPIWDYLKKRLAHLYIPYLVWVFIFAISDVIFDTISGKFDPSQRANVHFWANAVLLGSNTTHLWFLVWLVYFSLLLAPLFRWCVCTSLRWMPLFLALGGGYLVAWCHHWGEFGCYPVRLLGFLLLGMVGYKCKYVLMIRGWVLGVILGVGICCQGMGLRYGFLSECLISIPMCLLGLNTHIKNDVWVMRLRRLGMLSFGVYLVHPIFTTVMRVIVNGMKIEQTAFVFLLDQVIAFSASLVFAYTVSCLGRKFPILRHIQA